MRASWVMLFALTLAAPSLVLAEAAHGESVAHEVTEEESGHGAHDDGHGALTFSSLIRNREFQGTLLNFFVLVGLIAWVIRKKGNPALAARRAEVEKSSPRPSGFAPMPRSGTWRLPRVSRSSTRRCSRFAAT